MSDWVTDVKEAEAVEERLRTVLRAPHSNQSVEKPRNLCGKLVNFKAELFCSSQLDQHCAPRLVVLGRQWRCLLEKANTDLALVMCALQRTCHILSRGGVHHTSCLFLPFRIGGAPCRRRQRHERAETCPFLESTRANFGWRDFRELSFGAGHLFHSVSRLQHSGNRCSCFDGFNFHVVSVFLLFSVYSETLSRELRDVDV